MKPFIKSFLKTALCGLTGLVIILPTISKAYAQVGQGDCPKDHMAVASINVGGATLSVHCRGKSKDGKPTVILLHGFPEYWASWSDVGDILSKQFKVVLPDQRGYNLSSKPLNVSDYQFGNLVGDVIGLINSVSQGPVILVGHDFGGFIAYAVAAAAPGLVKGLVIVNAPHPNVYQNLFFADLDANPNNDSGQVAASYYIPTFFPTADCPFPSPPFPPANITCPFSSPEAFYSANNFQQLLALLATSGAGNIFDQGYIDSWNQTPGPLTTIFNWYRAITPLLLAPLPPPFNTAPNITVPTLVLWGLQDTALVPANADPANLSPYIPNLEVQTFADASHWIQIEKPIEVSMSIKQFIDRLIGDTQ